MITLLVLRILFSPIFFTMIAFEFYKSFFAFSHMNFFYIS